MNSLVDIVINHILSPYIEGVSRENLSVGMMTGNLTLSNVRLKSSIFDDLKIHRFRLKLATIDSIKIQIP